jgi:choline dehydrogenase-like flavoprotein
VLADLTADQSIWDIVVVGSGPVGMALALEFEVLGRDVLLIESGGMEIDPALAEVSRAEIVNPDRHAPMEIAVVRALGGTSWTWGGRCVAFDDVDWMPRSFIGDAPWPITPEEIQPCYAKAADYLLCGSDKFIIPYEPELSGGVTLDSVERWARESRVVLVHRERLLKSERIHVALRTTVTDFDLDSETSRIEAVRAASPNGPRKIKARHVILAMGGVETTRLLLASQRKYPRLYGGADGALGRFYMGHIAGKIADITFNNPAGINDLDFKLDASGAWYRRRYRLTTPTQLEHGLLNAAFWPDNPRLNDPAHRSGALSAVFLALAFPLTGRRLLPEAIRISHTGAKPYQWGAHLRNTILGGPRAARDLYTVLRDRFIRKPKKPGFLVPNAGGRYALNYHAEHAPHPDSRITLSDASDSFGLPRAKIDLQFSDIDVRSVIESHRLLDAALRANNMGRLEFQYPEAQLPEKIISQITDGFHQVGTTRMGNDPQSSVVDADLKAHGLENLYVASSSVFPTSSQANSTLLAVALAMRLTKLLTR